MVKIFRHYVPLTQIIRIIAEFSLLFISIPLGINLASNFSFSYNNTLLVGLLYACTVIVIMSSCGMYNRHLRDNIRATIFRGGITFSVAVMVMSTIFYSWPELSVSRRAFIYAILFSLLGLSITRFSCYLLIKTNKLYRKRILVYGAGHRANLIGQLRRKKDTQHYNCIAYLSIKNEKVKVSTDNVIDMPDNLFEYVKDNRIEEIIVALDDKRNALKTKELLDCRVYGVDVIELATFLEKHTGRIKLQSVHPSSLIFSSGFVRSHANERTKRVLDLISATVLFLVTWPIMLITALAIMIESGFKGSILYKQVRVGQQSINFKVFKFRSMSMDAEKSGAQWAQKNDNRVTKVGAFIRKVRIDELPQLFNVLRGEMSFVGPRPERPEFVSEFVQTIEFYEVRHFVKPGITGWAQVCYPYGATVEDTKNKLEFDLYYLKNYSLFLDSMIVLQTIQVVLWGQGR
jgi:sugar transferase (PEP-CTERM system associated)